MDSKWFVSIFLLLLAMLNSNCTLAPTTAEQQTYPTLPATQAVHSSPATVQPSPTREQAPSQTVEPPTAISTLPPSPELLTCPASEQPQADLSKPLEILFANHDQLWLWDEASQEKTLVQLPPDAVSPHISPDGRFAAYLIEGQSYDSPEKPQAEIPLWLFDLQNGQARQVAAFPVYETRQEYPESPHIYLRLRWLESDLEVRDEHNLLVEVYWELWAEAGCCVPGGDLYLVSAETGEYERILEAGEYYFLSFSPDGGQIAALDMQGNLSLIDISPAVGVKSLTFTMPENPWLVFAPHYSPDGDHMTLQVDDGLAVIDANSGHVQKVALENPCQDCYWGPRLPVTWKPDGSGFYTTASLNDNFDSRAETTLIQVELRPELVPLDTAVIQANPFTFDYSPDLRYLSYWNQPDLDLIETGEGQMNWVGLYLMDLWKGQVELYAEQFGLRVSSWSPDNQHFLYTYSSIGGANLDRKMFSLGNVCLPPNELLVPKGAIIDETWWLDASRFLAWTLPADGVPGRYKSGLYLYRLAEGDSPVRIGEILIDQSDPYGVLKQAVILRR